MIKTVTTLLFTLFFTYGALAQRQSKKDKATEIAKNAIIKMDNGELDKSIKMLEEAQKLDKDNSTYPYEIAYASYQKKDYKKSIEILQKIVEKKDALDEYYRLLGNSYDSSGNHDKALETYAEGIKLFPQRTGKFYSESGLVEYIVKNIMKQLLFGKKELKKNPIMLQITIGLLKLFHILKKTSGQFFIVSYL